MAESATQFPQREQPRKQSFVGRYALDALVVVLAFAFCMLSWEAFSTWQRVNALWGYVNQQIAQQQAPSRVPILPQPEQAPKK